MSNQWGVKMVTTEEMQDFINTDGETGKAFQALVNLTVKYQLEFQNNPQKAEQFLLEKMIEKDCFNDMSRVERFIEVNYTQLEIMGDELKPLRRGNIGVKI